jgi:CheY-like chemotaxis protein
MARRTALIIDDEPDITTYLGTLLSDHGFDVRTANAADEGLALARAQTPDVILLDVMMPDRGGLSTLIAIRKEEGLRAVPVILVTGVQQSLTADYRAFLDRFKHYHPDGYVEKPVDPDVLLGVIEGITRAQA